MRCFLEDKNLKLEDKLPNMLRKIENKFCKNSKKKSSQEKRIKRI